MVACFVLIAFTWFYSFQLWAAALVTFLWGIQDGSMNCFLNGVLGFEFESKTTPFSVFKALQSFLVFIFICVESFLVDRLDFMYYYIISAIFSVLSYLIIVLVFDFKVKAKSERQSVL